MPKIIEVTQRIGRESRTISIDAELIDYLKPGLGECEIYFVNGVSIVVKESSSKIRDIIKKTPKLR